VGRVSWNSAMEFCQKLSKKKANIPLAYGAEWNMHVEQGVQRNFHLATTLICSMIMLV